MSRAGRATGLGRLSRPLTTWTARAPFRLATAGIGRHDRGFAALNKNGVTGPVRWEASMPQRRFSTKKPVFEAGEAPSFAFAFE